MGFQIICNTDTCLKPSLVEDGYDNKGRVSFKVVGDNTVQVMCKTCGEEIYILDGGLMDLSY